ncbi:MAG: hypothetical protein AB8B61_09915 [Cyclobacteriaceae bacterium]
MSSCLSSVSFTGACLLESCSFKLLRVGSLMPPLVSNRISVFCTGVGVGDTFCFSGSFTGVEVGVVS